MLIPICRSKCRSKSAYFTDISARLSLAHRIQSVHSSVIFSSVISKMKICQVPAQSTSIPGKGEELKGKDGNWGGKGKRGGGSEEQEERSGK